MFEFDPTEIPFAARWKTSVANSIRNVVAKQRNQDRLIPSVPSSDELGIGIPSSEIAGRSLVGADEGVIDEFAGLVHERLGGLGSAVVKAKLDGDEANSRSFIQHGRVSRPHQLSMDCADRILKGLVGSVELGDPTGYRIKQTALAINNLVKEFARQRGDEKFEQQVEWMDSEQRTVEKSFGAKHST